MKKFKFLTIVFAAFVFASCEIPQEEAPGEAGNVTISQSTSTMKRKVVDVFKYEYEGHKYIMFTGNTGYCSIGVVHDPACPCRKEVIYYVDEKIGK